MTHSDSDNDELLSRVSKAADGTDTAEKDMVLCQVESVLMPPWDAGEHEGCGKDSERAFRAPESGLPTVDIPRWWVQDVHDKLFRVTLPSGPVGDFVFLLREQFGDILSSAPPPDSGGVNGWQQIESAPESIRLFAKAIETDPSRCGFIEYCGTIEDGRPFVLLRKDCFEQIFDRYFILPHYDPQRHVALSRPSHCTERREEQPRVTDNDAGEVSVTFDGKELRGWSYTSDDERRTKMLCAREYVEGWCDGSDAK